MKNQFTKFDFKVNRCKRFIIIIGFLLVINPVAAFGKDLPEFIIMTEDWIPYQYEENSRLKGIAVDLMVLMLLKVGSQQNREDIKMYPWALAYDKLQNQKNTILFSTTRTVEREKLFRWVGPIFQNITFLIAKKSQKININSINDIKKYKIGTIIDDASELFMTRLGFRLDQLQRNTKSIYNVEKLAIGRIDFIVSGWLAFENDAKILGINPNDYETVYQVDASDVSYAFHQKTPNWIIQKFQKALDEIKSKGKLDQILRKYKHLVK